MLRGWTFLYKLLGKRPLKIRILASKSFIVMDILAHMLDLGWIIYTSKHSCVYSLIRWEKREKRKSLGQHFYTVSLLSQFDQTEACHWRKQPLHSSVSFLNTPTVFFRSGYFPGFLFSSLLVHLHEVKGANNLLFSKGNEDVAVFLLRNGAFFCSYILMDSPESSKHLLRKYFIETTPLPGSAPAKTVSNHLSAWGDVVLKGHHVNIW